MIYSNCLLLVLFLIINSILPVYDRNLRFNNSVSHFKKIPSALIRAYDAVEQSQCPNGWERFGGSYYCFPNTKSTPNLASQTCSRYSNNSQLMKIRHLSEIYYAAYSLKIYNQSELILEIDLKLFEKIQNSDALSTKDWIKWQQANKKFLEVRDGFYHRRMNTSNRFSYDDEPVSFTLRSTDLTAMGTGNYKDFEQVSTLVHACDKIEWNAVKNDSNMFLLTTYLMSVKTVCSVNDIEPNEPSEFMCQYVLDYCLANDECGMFRRCINTLTGPKCSSYLPLFRDFTWRSISGSAIQMIIVVVINIVLQLYLRREGLKTLGARIKYILTCCKKEEATTENRQINISDTDDDSEEPTRFSWWLCFISILLVLLIIPIVYRRSLLQLNLIDQLDMTVVADDFKQMDAKCKHCSTFKGITIVSSVTVFFIVCLSLLINQRRETDGFRNVLTEFLIPFKSFELTNRYETAAVFGIVVFEVLTISNNFLFDFTELFGQGVLTKGIQTLWNLFIVIIKYYPIFVALRQNNVIISVLAFAYYMITLVFIIGDKMSCWNLFPRSENGFDIGEAKLYIMYEKWIVGFGLFRNILYFILLAYIGAEIIARFLNVLKRVGSKEVGVFTIILSNKTCDNAKRKPCCSCLRNIRNYFYPWDDKFQFGTISLCKYMGALIFVHYLTCTLTLRALMGRSSYINALPGIAELVLNIKIQDFLLWWEIILSGAITMSFFSYQLFTGMKNCKKKAKSSSQNTKENGSSTNSITSESIDYLKHCIPCMFGGVYIVFTLVLFTLIIVGRISTQFITVEQFLSYILSPFLIYIFETSIMSLCGKLSSRQSNENSRTVVNTASSIVYVILFTLVFIGTFHIRSVACFFRLLKKVLSDIISGTQIDCSKSGQPTEVLKDPCMEHKTNDSKISNSKHEGVKEDTRSLSATKVCDFQRTSSIASSQPGRELIPDTSLKILLSPDVGSIQTQPLLQQGHLSAITTSSEQSVIVNEFSSKRNRREKGDDDINHEQLKSLLLDENTHSCKRRTTAMQH